MPGNGAALMFITFKDGENLIEGGDV